MRPDPAYIRKLLTAFEDAPDPTTDINELQQLGLDYRGKEFLFHLRLLNDDGFVVVEGGEPGIGVSRSIDGRYSWAAVPLRLTASGHEFAQAMENEHGFQAVKKSLITSSMSIMRDVAVGAFKMELAKHGLPL
jgi:hypothetical protein